MNPQESKTKIIITDDHRLIVDGLKAILSNVPQLEIIYCCFDGNELIEYLQNASEAELPEIILLDIEMPNKDGIQTTAWIKNHYPEIKILIITVHKSVNKVRAAMNAKADGYMLKHTDQDYLVQAIQNLREGFTYFDPRFIEVLLKEPKNTDYLEYVEPKWTPRELEIINLISIGLTSNEVAERLFIAKNTVIRHRQNILEKGKVYDLNTMFAIIRYAMTKELIDD